MVSIHLMQRGLISSLREGTFSCNRASFHLHGHEEERGHPQCPFIIHIKRENQQQLVEVKSNVPWQGTQRFASFLSNLKSFFLQDFLFTFGSSMGAWCACLIWAGLHLALCFLGFLDRCPLLLCGSLFRWVLSATEPSKGSRLSR